MAARALSRRLGVEPSCTNTDVRQAYKKKALVHHPDRNGGVQSELFLRLKQAYDVLVDGRVVTLPRNFSWLWPGALAVSSTPKHGAQVGALRAALGVTLVITLTEEQPLR